MPLFLFMFLVFVAGFSRISCSESASNGLKPRKLAADSLCPFNFVELRAIVKNSSSGLNQKFVDVPTECYHLLEAFRMVRSQYLRSTGFFTIPPNASDSIALKPRKLAADSLCPFNFDELRAIAKNSSPGLNQKFIDVPTECYSLLQSIRIVRSQYLQSTGFFTMPPYASDSCWDSFQIFINERLGRFDVRSNCGVQTGWISNTCMNISTKAEFEALISEPQLQEIRHSCNQSLGDNSSCVSCVASLSSIQEAYFDATGIGNVTDCVGYPFMYAAAFANQFGPTDLATAKCLFSIDLTSAYKSTKKHTTLFGGVVIGCVIGFPGAIVVVWFLWRRHKQRRTKKEHVDRSAISSASGLGLIGESIALVKFTIEEMKEATRNFSRGNLIGKGGYGNVYRGILADGSEVALKRFKNCSISGDADFTHEVEVIASVRHVNLCIERVLRCNGSSGRAPENNCV